MLASREPLSTIMRRLTIFHLRFCERYIWNQRISCLRFRVNRLLCGIQLARIVFGYESFSIKHLVIDLSSVDRDCVPILARLVSLTLYVLDLSYDDEEESNYAILDQFFSQCDGIRNLTLRQIDFGEYPTSQTIKGGFYRLSQLSQVSRRSENVCGVRPNSQSSRIQQSYL
jgi:hypothetical protein